MKALSEALAALQRLDEAMNDEKRVMTCKEAAFVLDVTPATISRYFKEKRLHKTAGNGVTGVRAREVYEMLLR